MNVFLSVVGCSPKHIGWKSRRAWRQRRKRGKIWCPFSSCCSDINAKVRYMNYWMTTTTTLTSISYTATSTFASIICSPTGFTHVTCPSGWRGQRKNLLLCLKFNQMFGSGFVLMCTVLRTLHIVFVCVRDSFAVARIYQDDFEKVSIKPLGLNKSSETSILHSIGNLSFERRKQFLRKSFTKLWLRSLETWQDISIYGQQGKKQKISLSDLWWIITFIGAFFKREMIIIHLCQSSILKVKHHWYHFCTEQFGLKLSEAKMYHKIMTNSKANKITLCHSHV